MALGLVSALAIILYRQFSKETLAENKKNWLHLIWNNGILECWNNGSKGIQSIIPYLIRTIPIFQHSIIPTTV